jgi:hypothetical protein
MIRELPAGKGFADLVLLPYPHTEKHAMLIELKHNKDADTAIRQIKEKRYTGALENYIGEILLVGISYDDSKGPRCMIEKISR